MESTEFEPIADNQIYLENSSVDQNIFVPSEDDKELTDRELLKPTSIDHFRSSPEKALK